MANPQNAETAAPTISGQTAERSHNQAPNSAPANIVTIDAMRRVHNGSRRPANEWRATSVNAVVNTFGVRPGMASSSAVTFCRPIANAVSAITV